jgi:site-specific DNA-methyltransferase (adenine-specific)
LKHNFGVTLSIAEIREQRTIEKVIEKMESQKGFVQIPIKYRQEFIGNIPLPLMASVNGNPARLDKCGRIWSPFLKNKFHVGTKVKVSKTENGFAIELVESANVVAGPTKENRFLTLGGKEVSIDDKLYFKTDTIRIYNDDFLKTSSIEEKSIDLVVTSPPYNVDVQYENCKDDIPYDEYLAFTRKWLAKCYSLIKNDGRMCLNIPLDKNKGGQQSVCADITTIAKEIGWKYHATIIWNEQNISRRTAWGSWLSASAPFVIAPVEVIVILYKKTWQKTSGSQKSDIARDEFLEWTNGVWNFSGESKNKIGHPAPFPVELPKRCLKLFSFVGDTVLDPFLGSGTTLIACAETNRLGIGVEINKNYCELAKKRLEKHGAIYQQKLLQEGSAWAKQ